MEYAGNLAVQREQDSARFAGEKLAEARRGLDLTQKDLASKLGLRLTDVERIERGEADLEPYLPAICRHTGKPAS
jgi:transcriptional regulator with XRE-family HTH domain